MPSDEDLPEPSEKLTGPEKWLAERLTPYRVFWLKRILNVAIILTFLWAGFHTQNLLGALQEKGCQAVVEAKCSAPAADPSNFSSLEFNSS